MHVSPEGASSRAPFGPAERLRQGGAVPEGCPGRLCRLPGIVRWDVTTVVKCEPQRPGAFRPNGAMARREMGGPGQRQRAQG